MELVSVIIPCYNHGRFLAAAIESVVKQSHPLLEILIVDDASTDDTAQIAESYARRESRIRILTHARNRGLSAARNEAISQARGEWIGFCDADDVWLPNKLSRQLQAARDDLAVDVLYTDSDIIDEGGHPTGERFSELFPLPKNPSGDLFSTLCQRNFINIQTALVRRSRLASPAFDPSVALVNDWLLWIRLSRASRFLYLPEPTACYRIHSGSTNRTERRRYEINRLKVYKRTLRAHPGLRGSARAALWYHLGVCFVRIRWSKHARGCFVRALRLRSAISSGIPHVAKSIVRLLTA